MLAPLLLAALFASQAPSDVEPPLIEDLAVAAANPSAPPMITAVFSDDSSGVRLAEAFFRAPGAAVYEKVEFSPGEGGIFIARLPDGLQRTGFEYYVEVHDAAGNPPARLGSADRPLAVRAATETTAERLARQSAEDEVHHGIHPGWTMLALGAGVAAAAASGWFWLDFATVVTPQIAKLDAQLADASLTPGTRAALEEQRRAYGNAQVIDAATGSVLGVVAVAGLATGITLLVLGAVE